jgi:hypothetical protein
MRTFYTLFNTKNALKLSLVAAISWLGGSSLNAQITGNYEIDRGGTASSTVYLDFKSVIDDLRGLARTDGGYINSRTGGTIGGAFQGITGHATFTVKAGSGPYTLTTRLTIPDIAAMSSSATVTFKGNNEVLTYSGSSSARATIHMNGADWFRFDSLSIINTRTSYAQCVRFSNNADDNIFENCEIRTPNVTGATTSTASGSVCIMFGAVESSVNTSQWGTSVRGNNGSRNIIRNNSIGGREGSGTGSGPRNAIILAGNSGGDGTEDNLIQDNYISNIYMVAINMEGADGTTIDGNEITNPDVTNPPSWGSAAINMDNSTAITSKETNITKNRIHHQYGTSSSGGAVYYGIWGRDVGNGDMNINNNTLYDVKVTNEVGLIIIGTRNAGKSIIYHNTAAIKGTGVGNPALFGCLFNGSTQNTVRNNNMEITFDRPGPHWGYFDRGTSIFDNNNAFIDRSGTGNPTTTDYYGQIGGTNIANLTAWQAQGRGLNSTDEFSNFLNYATGDLRPLNFTLNNTGVGLGVLDDINDSARSTTTPDVGAFEIKLDASVTAFPWTDFSVCGNFQDSVRITIKNNNFFPIKDVPVFYQINAARVDEIDTTTIPAGGSVDYTFSKMAKFNDPGANTFSAGIGVADDNLTNNSISYTVTVTSSPTGSMLTSNPGTGINQPIYNLSGCDVTVPGAPLDYTFSAPTGYTTYSASAGAGNWSASSQVRTIAGGTVVAGATADAPGTNDINVQVDPPVNMTDSPLMLYVTFVDPTTGCDTTYEKCITVAPRGIPDFGFPPVICENVFEVFDNLSTVSSGFLEYEWRIDSMGTIVGGALNTNPAFAFSAGTYDVTLVVVTDPYGYRDSVTKTVTVTPIPVVDFVRVNACEGQNVTLTNTTVPINSNFTWDFGDGSPTVNTVNAFKSYVPGGYAVTLKAEKNGCASEITKNVYQFAKPVANGSLLSGSCSNEAFKFNNTTTISNGNTGYLWDFDEPNAISTDPTPSYTFQTHGTKQVRLKSVSEFGCEDTLDAPITVIVKEAPQAAFAIDDACSETPTTFTNNSTAPASATNNYTWTIEGNTAVNNNTTFTHNWSALGKQTVTLVAAADNSCTDVNTQEINVKIQPIANFELGDVCQGETVQIPNLTTWPAGDVTYSWTIGISASTSTSTDGAPTAIADAAPGNYNVSLTSTITGGCSSTKVIPIEVKPLPETCDFTIDDDFSNGINNYDLNPTGGSTANTNYTWVYSFGGSDVSTNAGKQDLLIPKTAGIGPITVTMIADRNGCKCSKTVTRVITSNKTLPNGAAFKVYPNPTEGNVNIEIANNNQELVIEIFNAVGTRVATVETNNQNNGSFKADLSNLASGLYIVKVKSGATVTTQRITLTK